VKIEFDNDESWNLLTHIVGRLLEEVDLPDADRARIRRWKSDEMRVTSQEMRVVTQKINEDLAMSLDRKTKSQLRKPDWI
jgi:hypothetical protein